MIAYVRMDFRSFLRYKNSIMLRFLKSIFRRETARPGFDARKNAGQLISPNRNTRDSRRKRGEGYKAVMDKMGLDLRLIKPRILAWAENPVFRYTNAVIEATIRFPADENPDSIYAAAGILFRYFRGIFLLLFSFLPRRGFSQGRCGFQWIADSAGRMDGIARTF